MNPQGQKRVQVEGTAKNLIEVRVVGLNYLIVA